jgi:hypothetical protein
VYERRLDRGLASGFLGQVKRLLVLLWIVGGAACAGGGASQSHAREATSALANCHAVVEHGSQPSTLAATELVGAVDLGDEGSLPSDCTENKTLSRLVDQACEAGADIVNITEEHPPDQQSSCYRAKAQLLRSRPTQPDPPAPKPRSPNHPLSGWVAVGALMVIGSLVLGVVIASSNPSNRPPTITGVPRQ